MSGCLSGKPGGDDPIDEIKIVCADEDRLQCGGCLSGKPEVVIQLMRSKILYSRLKMCC